MLGACVCTQSRARAPGRVPLWDSHTASGVSGFHQQPQRAPCAHLPSRRQKRLTDSGDYHPHQNILKFIKAGEGRATLSGPVTGGRQWTGPDAGP